MASRREQQGGDVEDRYRHVRHHPVFGGRGSGGRRATSYQPGRRAGSGPRPVRPLAPAASTRPPQPEWPQAAKAARVAAGSRVLVRRPAAPPSRVRVMLHRAVAALALAAATALAVVALGLVADAVSAARQPAAPATVTIEAPGAVPDVSR